MGGGREGEKGPIGKGEKGQKKDGEGKGGGEKSYRERGAGAKKVDGEGKGGGRRGLQGRKRMFEEEKGEGKGGGGQKDHKRVFINISDSYIMCISTSPL